MKIRMLVSLSGADYSLSVGDVPADGQLSPGEMKRLVESGAAELVETARATSAGVERARKRSAKA